MFDGHINKSNHHNTTVWKVLKKTLCNNLVLNIICHMVKYGDQWCPVRPFVNTLINGWNRQGRWSEGSVRMCILFRCCCSKRERISPLWFVTFVRLNEAYRNLQQQGPFLSCSLQHGTTSWSFRESFILWLILVALLFEIWSLTVAEA